MIELTKFSRSKHHIDVNSKNMVLQGVVPCYKYIKIYTKDDGSIMLYTSDYHTNGCLTICKARNGKKKWIYVPQLVEHLYLSSSVNFELSLSEKGDGYYLYKLVLNI